MEEKEIKVRPFFVKSIILEAITIALIVISVLAVRIASPKIFEKLQKWYIKNILDETTISEVVEKGGKYEI